MDTITFNYRPRLRSGIAMLLFSVAFSAGMVWIALGNDKGLRILGIVLPPSAATVFYAFCAVFFALGILAGAKMIGASFGPPKQVILSTTEITAPASQLSRKTRVVPYANITGMRVQTIQHNTFLIIKSNQRTLSIPKVSISERGAFDALCAALDKRVMASRVKL